MGIKSLISLQMIPWCFPLKWNHVSCVPLRATVDEQSEPEEEEESGTSSTIKLIKSDGVVKIYNQPISASDLMMEFPKHLICHSDSFYIGQKIQPLSQKDKLQLGHKYFLLPNHFFQSVLSFVTIASFASASISQSSSSSPLVSSSSSSSSSSSFKKQDFLKKVTTNCQPFDIRKTPSGSLQIRVSDEFISKLMEVGRDGDDQSKDQSLIQVGGDHHDHDHDHDQQKRQGKNKLLLVGGGSKVCTTPQLQKEYSQLVGSSSRQWKPKLETITESKKRRKIAASLGGMMIKMHRSNNKKSHHHQSSRLFM